MDEYLKNIIKNFEGKNFQDFFAYVYSIFNEKIDVSKGKQKNKYIKIRNEILKYIVYNRRNVTLNLRQKKYR